MSESNQLTVIENLNPLQVFSNDGLDLIIAKIEAEVKSVVLDISTEEGRKQIASLAYKVARSKTALDTMGKGLTEEWKAKAGAVDAERKRMRDRLDAIRDEVRAPLTAWEDQEKARVAGHEAALAALPAPAEYGLRESAAEILKRLTALETMPPRDWQEFTVRAGRAVAEEIDRTKILFAAAEKRETEAAEIARLRQEEADRRQREHEERLKVEAAAKAQADAEAKARLEAEAEAARVRAEREQAERERRHIQQERDEAEARAEKAEKDRIAAIAQAEADRKAAAERAERDRIAAAERAKREAEAAAQAERDRIATHQKAEAEAQEKREANKRHKAKIHREALAGLVAAGCAEDVGNVVIDAIAAGAVAHLAFRY